MPDNEIATEQIPEKIFSGAGVPFKTEQIARSAIEKKGLDPNLYIVQSYDGGYIIVPKPKQIPEKYYKVRFNQKSDPNQEDDVTLIVNGEVLLMQRGVDVIIPGRFKECADHATYPQFRQKPNEPRKVVANIQVFPYALSGEATEEEYKKQLASGNKKTREDLEKTAKLLE